MSALATILAVGAAGLVGGLARSLLSQAGAQLVPALPQAGTLAANLIGCALAGALPTLLAQAAAPGWLITMILTGILGAFTTVATFALELLQLIEARRHLVAAAYGLATVGLAPAAAWAGFSLVAAGGS